jgi:hypothetical protein
MFAKVSTHHEVFRTAGSFRCRFTADSLSTARSHHQAKKREEFGKCRRALFLTALPKETLALKSHEEWIHDVAERTN